LEQRGPEPGWPTLAFRRQILANPDSTGREPAGQRKWSGNFADLALYALLLFSISGIFRAFATP
jgi:hypothetical protein